jgi:hypothetical protein
MTHGDVRRLLHDASSHAERCEAMGLAAEIGMPFSEMTEYLDWLDMVRSSPTEPRSAHASRNGLLLRLLQGLSACLSRSKWA